MTIAKILVCVGVLAIAGMLGVLFGIVEEILKKERIDEKRRR